MKKQLIIISLLLVLSLVSVNALICDTGSINYTNIQISENNTYIIFNETLWDNTTGIPTYNGNVKVRDNFTANDVIIPEMNLNSNYSSVNDFFKLFTSAGRLTGGMIYDNGSQQVNVSAGSGTMRILDDDVSQVKFINWDEKTNINIPTDSIVYIGVDYNGGSPTIVNYTNSVSWDLDTNFPLGTVINLKDDLYVLNDPWWVGDGLTNIIERFQGQGTERDNEVGGLILGYTGTRNPTLTSGKLWARLNEFIITNKDCSGADDFYEFYRDGAGSWNRKGPLQQWNNTHYDDNSGTLQPIDNNKYVNIWVFVEIDSDNGGQLMLIYPQNQYVSSAAAEAESVPAFPSTWYKHGILVGRILIKKGVDIPIQVQSAFDIIFTPSQATDHSQLSNLGWSSSGHTIDSNIDMSNNDLINFQLNWTQLQNYPVSCPEGTYVTQIDDIITCTAAMRTDGENVTGNYGITGSLGIGTNTPNELLDVKGGAIEVGWLSDTFDQMIEFYRNGQIGVIDSNAGDVNIRATDDNNVRIRNTDDDTVFIVTDDEKVGINTLTPQKELHVDGSVMIEDDLYLGGDLFTIIGTILNINTSQIPFFDSTFDLGNTSNYWRNLFVDDINVTNDVCINGGNCLSDSAKTISGVPAGAIMSFYNSTCPIGWELADGTDGTPDLTGRMIIGVGEGTDINSVSRTFAFNETGGEYNHTLSYEEMPTHNHGISYERQDNTDNTGGAQRLTNLVSGIAGTYDRITTDEGNNESHNIVQPYRALIYCMKT